MLHDMNPTNPMMRIILAITLATAWEGSGEAADQVTLHLSSGQTVTGELVSEDADKVVLKSTLATKSGKAMSMSKDYPRNEVLEIVHLADPEETYKTRAAAAKTADDQAALATWCRDQGMTERAVAHARKALAIDPKHDDATKLLGGLGWVEADGAWVLESEWLAGQGKVRYQGKIMTNAEADALKAQLQEKDAVKGAQQAVDDKTAALAALDRRIADLPKRPAEIDAEIAKAKTDLTTAQGGAQRIAGAKATLDGAEKRLSDAQASARAPGTNGQPGTGNAPAQNFAPLQQAVEDAQKAYNAAKRETQSGDQDSTRSKSRIAALTEEKKTLEKKGADLKAQREALAKDLEQAKAALEAKKKAAASSPPPAPPAP